MSEFVTIRRTDYELLQSTARVRLEALNQCHIDYGKVRDDLRRQVADLRARVRAARREALGQNVSRALWALLDLRRPVAKPRANGRKGKARR